MKLQFKGATILLTGASSGIGEEMARLLAGEARTLVLVARRKDRLDRLAHELSSRHPQLRVIPIAADLSTVESIDAMLAEAQASAGGIDVLINNAGVGDFTLFDQSQWPKLQQMFQTNMIAPAYLCHRLLPDMIRKGKGGILNVSSLAGYFVIPGMASYNGSKFFLTGLTEALRAEVAGTGVVVSQLCPGPVRTEFVAVAAKNIPARTPAWMETSAKSCAEGALTGFRNGHPIIIPGWPVKIFATIYGLLPEFVRRASLAIVGSWVRGSPQFAYQESGI